MLARPSALALRSRPRRALTTSRERAPAYPASDLPWLCVVGATVASWWRGAWYVMDAALYPDDAPRSCAASLALGFCGFAACHQSAARVAPIAPAARGAALYAAALANVAAWRGVWLAWDLATGAGPGAAAPVSADAPPTADELAERRRVLVSGVASHACATALLVGACHLTSALAPPARIAVLSDKTLWSYRPSRYLEDVAMYIKQTK